MSGSNINNTSTNSYSYSWPPLESDPSIFNNYFQDVGLPEFFGFQELITLDPKEISIQYSDFPIFGVIAAINRNKISHQNTSNDNVILPSNSLPFFMRQTRELDNACGLIAALHLFGNNMENIGIPEESILKRFFNGATNYDLFERAKFLEDFSDLKLKHQAFANQGQSYTPNLEEMNSNHVAVRREINHHFISILNYDNQMLELDGTQLGPILLKKKVSNENFLREVVEEFNKKISKGLIGEDLSILFLTYM